MDSAQNVWMKMRFSIFLLPLIEITYAALAPAQTEWFYNSRDGTIKYTCLNWKFQWRSRIRCSHLYVFNWKGFKLVQLNHTRVLCTSGKKWYIHGKNQMHQPKLPALFSMCSVSAPQWRFLFDLTHAPFFSSSFSFTFWIYETYINLKFKWNSSAST